MQVQERYKLTHFHSSSKPTTDSKCYLNQTLQKQRQNLLLIRINLNIYLLSRLDCFDQSMCIRTNLSVLIKFIMWHPSQIVFELYVKSGVFIPLWAFYLHLIFLWFLPFSPPNQAQKPNRLPWQRANEGLCHRPLPVTTIAMAIGSPHPPQPPIRWSGALIDWAMPRADVSHCSPRQMRGTDRAVQ